MQKGDIVLITFPFTDLSGYKLRPAVILIESKLDITASFITTQLEWEEKTDVLLEPTALNGLRKLSLIRLNKIATLDKVHVKGLLGQLNESQLRELNTKLKELFQLT